MVYTSGITGNVQIGISSHQIRICMLFQELKQKEHSLRDDTSKKLKLQEKQIHQLVEGFQSQLELIEVLKQQKV